MYLSEWLLPDVGYIDPSGHYGTFCENDGRAYEVQQGIHHFAPLNIAYHTKLPYFDWLELPQHTHRLKRLEHSMTGTGAWEVKDELLRGMTRTTFCRITVTLSNTQMYSFPLGQTRPRLPSGRRWGWDRLGLHTHRPGPPSHPSHN